MDWLAAFENLVAELGACSDVTLEKRTLIAETDGIDEDLEADVIADGQFALDDTMREFWGQVREVLITYRHSGFDGTGIMGKLDIGQLCRDICFSGYTPDQLDAMGPRDDDEKALLLELRHIDTHTRAGDQWLAFRSGSGEIPTLWWRTPTRAGIDVPLSVDFEGLLRMMLKSRGVIGWPLLCADLGSIDRENRVALVSGAGCDAYWLRRALTRLGTIDTARSDAAELLDVLDGVVKRWG